MANKSIFKSLLFLCFTAITTNAAPKVKDGGCFVGSFEVVDKKICKDAYYSDKLEFLDSSLNGINFSYNPLYGFNVNTRSFYVATNISKPMLVTINGTFELLSTSTNYKLPLDIYYNGQLLKANTPFIVTNSVVNGKEVGEFTFRISNSTSSIPSGTYVRNFDFIISKLD